MSNSYLESLVNERKSKGETRDDDIKNVDAINLASLIRYVKNGISEIDFDILCKDIRFKKTKIGMDKNAIDLLLANKDNINVQKMLKAKELSAIDIDLNDLTELSTEKVNEIKDMGINIRKVFVNSGWDKGAARGYDFETYRAIVSGAERMVNAAKSKLEKQNPGKSFENMGERDKFMALYNAVITGAKYNKKAVDSKGEDYYTSRNLQDYFLKNKSAICAGFADVLVQLCKMNGLEIEYVQGNAQSKNMKNKEYHAWVRVKIDGKWYNADPTWDANHIKGQYGYCLKSDAEFDGHFLDKNYCPTYKRNSKDEVISSNNSRVYESADYSYDSDELAKRYYTDEMGNRLEGYSNLTEEQARKLMEERVPNAGPGSGGLIAETSFLTIFIKLLIKLASLPAKLAENIKKKFQSNKHDKSKLAGSDSGKYIKEVAKKEESFSDIRVDTSKADRASSDSSKSIGDNSMKEREDR